MAADDADNFGNQLRRLRLARGLTQESLAEKAGLSPRAIGALEQGERRAAHRDTIRLLAEALGLPPQDRERLEMAAASQRKRQPRQHTLPPSPRHNLPAPLSSFVGREREVREVRRLLGQTRLLTLTGTGGAGKTRLAMEVAGGLVGEYPEGVWLIELASIARAELVPGAVAATVGVREQSGVPLIDTLGAFLSPKQLLLLLDNCEHVIDAVAELTRDLLVRCPGVRVLATSREALRIAGETRWTVPTLSVPGPAPSYSVASLSGYEAVSLFTERATARQPSFRIDSSNATAVVEVCRRMDGLPLAVELAAARVDVLTPMQIAERLRDFSHLLTGGERGSSPRQRTLEATLEWSYDLLTAPERQLFAQLSVFSGGWTLESAGAVACTGGEAEEVFELLARLVEKSLVTTVEVNGEMRYGLLEPVRRYAAQKLEESGEAEAMRRRHAEYYLELSEKVEPELDGPQQAEWLDRLETDRDNLRTALEWALREDSELAARLCSALWLYWYDHGHILEGRRWMESVVARSKSLPVSVRIKLLNTTGDLAWSQADYGRAAQLLEEALGLARKGGNRRDMTLSLNHLGNVAIYKGEYERAIRLLEESLVLEREARDRRGIAASLTSLGSAVLYMGDCERAMQLLEESLSIEQQDGNLRGIAAALTALGNVTLSMAEVERATQLLEKSLVLKRRVGNKRGTAVSLNSLARVSLHQGDAQKAEQLLYEGLALAWQLGDQHTVATSLELLCQVATARRETEQATLLGGAAEALRKRLSFLITPIDSPHHDRCVRELRSRMGITMFDNAWQTGRATALDEVVASALTTVSVGYLQIGDPQG